MRSVRCDACGAKALMAASQCPKCGHLFEVRDGFGELLPLGHCPSCDAYYPAHVQSCKWCGTTLIPEKPRKSDGSNIKWIAAGTVAVAVLLGFLARDPGPKLGSRAGVPERSKPKATARVDSAAEVRSAAPAVRANPGETVADGTDALANDVSTPANSAPAVPDPAVIPQTGSAPYPVVAPPAMTPRQAAATTSPRERRPASPWVSMVAKQWVIVRADAHPAAHVVASVGPNSRVQLGETRGSWRRIKLRGIAGWVDASGATFVAVQSARRRSSSHIASTVKR